MNEKELPELLSKMIVICEKAGDIILSYYNENRKAIETKDDDSPLTKADLESDRYIWDSLGQDIPIISEENYPEYEDRKDFCEFFLVDPLDGTKEFLDGNGEFTVNIAYLKDKRPVMGVIHAPVLKTTFFAAEGLGAYRKDQDGISKLPLNKLTGENLIATGSRKHSTCQDEQFMHDNGITDVRPAGSSLKFCEVAMGNAHMYPRFQGSMEWDIAAAHIIVNEAGCKIYDLVTLEEPLYNKTSLKNDHFLVLGQGPDISSIKLPE